MARRASFTSPEDGGRHASFTGVSRPDMADGDLFSDVDDDELRALGLIPTTTEMVTTTTTKITTISTPDNSCAPSCDAQNSLRVEQYAAAAASSSG